MVRLVEEGQGEFKGTTVESCAVSPVGKLEEVGLFQARRDPASPFGRRDGIVAPGEDQRGDGAGDRSVHLGGGRSIVPEGAGGELAGKGIVAPQGRGEVFQALPHDLGGVRRSLVPAFYRIVQAVAGPAASLLVVAAKGCRIPGPDLGQEEGKIGEERLVIEEIEEEVHQVPSG